MGKQTDGRIGVGITTHNRPEVLERALSHWRQYLPPDALLVVVDDGSSEPVQGADYRFETPVGIARAKNKCMELLAPYVGHMFLADDDVWPTDAAWWTPYVNSPLPHLMYLFKDPTPTGHADTPPEVYRDEHHFGYSHPRGCLLYAQTFVLYEVGGMDPGYGRWGWEHVDWSQRVYNAGLTPAPFLDVHGSSSLWYSMDEHWKDEPQFTRSVPRETRRALLAAGQYRFQTLRTHDRWLDYEPQGARSPMSDTYAVTFLLNGTPDTQRGRTWEADPSLVTQWARSIRGAQPIIVSDCIDSHPDAKVFKVAPLDMNVYFARWAHAVRLMDETMEPDDRVFFTDGTDVTMLREPWDHMTGTVLVGEEPTNVGNHWMRQNMKDPRVRRFIKDNPDLPLLNAGVIGGEVDPVRRFIRDILGVYYTHPDQGTGDNGALNLIAYSPTWLAQIEHGPHVTNTFKSYADNGQAWWMHK